jgi:hypothetical protein
MFVGAYTGTARDLLGKSCRCRDHTLQVSLLVTDGLDMGFAVAQSYSTTEYNLH